MPLALNTKTNISPNPTIEQPALTKELVIKRVHILKKPNLYAWKISENNLGPQKLAGYTIHTTTPSSQLQSLPDTDSRTPKTDPDLLKDEFKSVSQNSPNVQALIELDGMQSEEPLTQDTPAPQNLTADLQNVFNLEPISSQPLIHSTSDLDHQQTSLTQLPIPSHPHNLAPSTSNNEAQKKHRSYQPLTDHDPLRSNVTVFKKNTSSEMNSLDLLIKNQMKEAVDNPKKND
ncbi:MAG: hypothetical protein HAW62_01910 [Endozoicomonadaceae bacterium]|nr:hypothetical protein [Endozoicomonadaceae bacterium]